MKKTTLNLLAALALALTGCVVTAVYPFYTPKDIVFEPTLLGKWQEADPQQASKIERWLFEKEDAKSYQFTISKNGDKDQVYAATLFALGKDRFLDLVQTEPHPGALYLPPHILGRVLEIGPTLKVAVVDYDWLKKFLEKQPSAIRHTRMGEGKGEGDKLIVLTAETKELQPFIRKHLNTEKAWSDAIEMKRVDAEK